MSAAIYPVQGIYHLLTDAEIARPIVVSTLVALVQSGIVTGGYVYFSFKYIKWFVTHHLLNFSYFNLRPLFGLLERVSGSRVSKDDMEWYTAGLLTLFQAAVLANALVGYKLRAQGIKAGNIILSKHKRKKVVVQREASSGFLYRVVKSILWTTFITPIYAIPGLGQALFIYFRAPNIARTYLASLQATEYAQYKYSAIAFGITAGVLESIPFVGQFFVITNTIGAALWIKDADSAS